MEIRARVDILIGTLFDELKLALNIEEVTLRILTIACTCVRAVAFTGTCHLQISSEINSF